MTPPPSSLSCRTVELAVRVLPAEHRQRYGLEFIAELYGMPKAQQRRHSARPEGDLHRTDKDGCFPHTG